MKKAVYAGSFDPITKGHEFVIKEASRLFDEVTVLLSINPDKTSFFSTDQKTTYIKDFIKNLSNVHVVTLDNQYVADYCKYNDVNYLIRGVRNSADLEYEKTVSEVNYQINPNLQSIFILPPPHLSMISSSVVKGMVGFTRWQMEVEKMVSPKVVSGFLRNRYKNAFGFLNNSPAKEDFIDKVCDPTRYYHGPQHI